MPLFFTLDKTNYVRWLPIHIHDMKAVPGDIRDEFAPIWVLLKTQNRFSYMALDQAHEQNNEVVKGPSGAIGLTENPAVFRHWMVA